MEPRDTRGSLCCDCISARVRLLPRGMRAGYGKLCTQKEPGFRKPSLYQGIIFFVASIHLLYLALSHPCFEMSSALPQLRLAISQ